MSARLRAPVNRVDGPASEIETDGFKKLFASTFVANNFNFRDTMDKMRADGGSSPVGHLSRIGMLSDPDTARYIREELAKRRDQYFFTAEDIAAGMYAIAADPENTPEQRFPYYKVLAEATGLIGKGKQTAQDTAPAHGVVIQIANYGGPDQAQALPTAPYIDDVTKPSLKPASDGTPAIIPCRASGKRTTPTDAEVDAMAGAALPPIPPKDK